MELGIQKLYNMWLENASDDVSLIEELKEVKDNEDAIYDRFYRSLEFGTAGLRGVIGAGTNRMNIYNVRVATQGLANYLLKNYEKSSVSISYDSRIKSELFASEAARVLAANGIKVYLSTELQPTPVVSYAVRYFKSQAGIMVTASHNPAKYNGYKCYGYDGCQMTDKAAAAVYDEITKLDCFKDVKIVDFSKALENGTIEYIGDEFYETHDEIHENTGFKQSYTVVGIIEQPVFEKPGCAWYAAISLVDESTLSSDTFNALLMTDTKKLDSDFHTQLMDIVGDNKYYSNSGVLIFSGSSDENSLNVIVTAAQTFFVILIALISIMLIYNVFALSYDERVKYLGMLSSVGATGKQKRSSVYFEAFIMLLPALPIGFALGLGTVKIAANTAGPMAEKLFSFDGTGVLNLKPVLAVSPAAVITVILLSIITVFISALIPARKISKVGPIESIRGTKKSGKSRNKAKGNPDRLIGRSAAGMLSSRFFKNDKSKSLGIIRAVAIFFLVTVAVYFGTSLVMMMVDYKLGDNGLSITYGDDRNYSMVVIDTGDQMERDELIDMIKNSEGTSDVTVIRFDSWSLRLPSELLSDEYWNADYEIECMFHEPGELSKDEFIKEQKSIDRGTTFISVTAFEDEVFDKMAKEVKAASYGEGELPCILIKNAYFSTDQILSERPRDYKYIEVRDPYACNDGEVIPLYSNAHSRAEAEEYGLEWDKLPHPEIDLDGAPANFKVIKKVNTDEISDYMEGTAGSGLNIIVPMSVAEYIDKINVQEMVTGILFNCDNEATVKMFLDLSDQLNDLGGNLALNQAGSSGAEFREIIAYLIRTVLIVFLAIASAICLLNVYSSISGLMVSRRKQFAVLKSMGSTFSQLLKTELRESIRMLIAAIVIAFPITGIICWLLAKTFIGQFGYFTVSFPWLQSAGLIIFIAAAVLLMIFICLRRENKIDIIDEIKRESV